MPSPTGYVLIKTAAIIDKPHSCIISSFYYLLYATKILQIRQSQYISLIRVNLLTRISAITGGAGALMYSYPPFIIMCCFFRAFIYDYSLAFELVICYDFSNPNI